MHYQCERERHETCRAPQFPPYYVWPGDISRAQVAARCSSVGQIVQWMVKMRRSIGLFGPRCVVSGSRNPLISFHHDISITPILHHNKASQGTILRLVVHSLRTLQSARLVRTTWPDAAFHWPDVQPHGHCPSHYYSIFCSASTAHDELEMELCS